MVVALPLPAQFSVQSSQESFFLQEAKGKLLKVKEGFLFLAAVL